ncbi:hypothetical protein EMCG_03767 [[Emmonsia] crescens]|uniref:non-specific serine/threonine protein kinase n=1 Tax=[Emmonsia] crescens TaxID=73230 RepID=A0A0G2HUJ3_9EURO|nr:hypothetical protein EMCG_03767 [Emmonsia crescens UAMH 3008]
MCNSTASAATGNASCFEYRWIDGAENVEKYQPGGYHPVVVGDELTDRYKVIHKLGHGAFSTIWLARDKDRASYVAIKVSTANAPPREAEILHALVNFSDTKGGPGREMVPVVQDRFELQGPNGCHRCYVTSPAQSSVAAAKFCDLFTVETARVLVAQLVSAVAYIHFRGVVHGAMFDALSVEQVYERFNGPQTQDIVRVDGKPLLPNAPPHATLAVWIGKTAHDISPSEARLVLSDFGEAFSPATEKRRGDEYHAPLTVVAPEVLFRPETPISFAVDIWALACVIWSIFGTRPIFDGTLATWDDIAAQQVDIFGYSSVPREWWDGWEERHRYFDKAGQPNAGRSVFPSLESSFEEDVQAMRRGDDMADFGSEETIAIFAMLRGMLVFRPEERATAEDVMGCKWMKSWGLPELEKARKT